MKIKSLSSNPTHQTHTANIRIAHAHRTNASTEQSILRVRLNVEMLKCSPVFNDLMLPVFVSLSLFHSHFLCIFRNRWSSWLFTGFLFLLFFGFVLISLFVLHKYISLGARCSCVTMYDTQTNKRKLSFSERKTHISFVCSSVLMIVYERFPLGGLF